MNDVELVQMQEPRRCLTSQLLHLLQRPDAPPPPPPFPERAFHMLEDEAHVAPKGPNETVQEPHDIGVLVLPKGPEESILFRHNIGRSLLALHSDQLPGGAILSHEDEGVAATGHSPPGVQAVHYVVPVEHALRASPGIVARRLCSRAHHEELRQGRPPRARPGVPARASLKETWLRIYRTSGNVLQYSKYKYVRHPSCKESRPVGATNRIGVGQEGLAPAATSSTLAVAKRTAIVIRYV